MEEYDEIYSVGCFDFFHKGHENILNYMKQIGKTVIVGVHDDRSIERLKNLSKFQHQPIEKRVRNVKTRCDVVFVIPNTDPTLYIEMIHNKDPKLKQAFVRADDNSSFPGREYVGKVMEIKLYPYTQGVSSTQIRNQSQFCI